jgi:sugar lactone lactonase YvrE
LEDRRLLSVTLTWSGPGTALNLAEGVSGATPAIAISEPSPNESVLEINLGAGYAFASGSTLSESGLTYQNAGSPTTSQSATINIGLANNVSSLAAALPGDYLTLGPIRDLQGGVESITASAATIEVTGIDTLAANGSSGQGNVSLAATGNLTVDPGAIVQTGTGTLSLAADVQSNGAGDDGVGTLSIGAGATVTSTNSSPSAITLRGAAVNIDTSANPAVVGGQRALSSTRTTTLIGGNFPSSLAFDPSGNLYVANRSSNTISRFAPGATTPAATLTGLYSPYGLAFDAHGDLYVSNFGGNTVSEFSPGATTPTATLTGLEGPAGLVFDGGGDLFVTDWSGNNGTTVSKFSPGSTTPTATLSGLSGPLALAFGPDGKLYVANNYNNSVSEFAPGATTPTTNLASVVDPFALAFDPVGDLYVATAYSTGGQSTVPVFAPGATTPTSFLTGLSGPGALAFDSSGNLYVGNLSNNTISEFAPGATTPAATLAGLSYPISMAFDATGSLYVANATGNTVSKFAPVNSVRPATGGVVIRSSLPSRPMSIGGTSNAVNGINLTDAELSRVYTTATGTVTIGDSSQTGNITFTTATPATMPGAATMALQSLTGSGGIILDDGGGTGTALNGNGGTISLSGGTGGVAAASANNSAAEIATTGATVTINTTGPVGTAANRIQFADDSNTAQQNVQIGSTIQPSSVFLDGLGSLTLGNIQGGTANTQIDATARTNLVVAAGGTINSGAGTLSLGADLNPDGTGNDGVGTLSINAGATVTSTNSSSNAITLRGATINIDTSTDPTLVGVQHTLNSTPTTTLTGAKYPYALAFDRSGNLYVADYNSSTVSEFAPGATTPTATLTGLNYPMALVFDRSGNLFVANEGGTTVSEFAPGATTPTATLVGLQGPDALAFNAAGNLYVANGLVAGTVSEFAPGATTPMTMLTGLAVPVALAFDSLGNLYVVNNRPTGTVSKFAPGATTPTATLSGLIYPTALAFDAGGNLYVTNDWLPGTVSEFAPDATTPIATLTGLEYPSALAFDATGDLFVADGGATSTAAMEFTPGTTTPMATLTGGAGSALIFDASGNLYAANYIKNTVSNFALATVATAGGVVVRSSLPSRPMSIGGANNVVNGINVTDAELAQLYTTASGTVTFGDSSQTGNITFTSATPATTPGASTVVVQSTTGPGQIVLDDTGSGTGLNGNGGSVTLTPGTGGILMPLNTSGVPLATQGFNPTGLMLSLSLNFAPALGTQLTVINNTASPATSHPITGTFANLPQGGTISATYNGATYWFQANYGGGDGNDLVLTEIAIPTATSLGTSQPAVTYGTPVTFTATVSAQSGSTAPIAGSVDFYDTTTSTDLGLGTLANSTGTTSTWTFSTGARSLSATSGDIITATYTPGASFAGSSGNTTEVVTAIPVTVTGITAANKTYNGNTTATLEGLATASLVGVLSGDTVTLGTSGVVGTLASKDVAQNVVVSVSGLTLDGPQAEDYTLTQPTATANITPTTLTVSGITAVNKVYNANTTASLSTTAAALVGLFSGDAVTLGTSDAAGAFASKDVAQNITVFVSGLTIGGAQAGDYTLAQPTATANITPAPLTVLGIAASDKTYDGSTSAVLKGLAEASLLGVLPGDTVDLTTIGAIGAFADRNAGTNKTVFISGLAIDNPDYSLTQLTTTANITAQPITVAAIPDDKIYDGTTSAAVVPTFVSGSLVAGDTAAFSETFDNKNVGVGKTLTAVGSVNDGNGGNNYTVTFLTDTTGAIAPCSITVTATANSKAYDGTTTASAVPAITTGSLAFGDTLAFIETYDSSSVGTGKTLTPSGSVNDGDGGANYNVTFVTSATGIITQTVDHFLVAASPTNVTAGNAFLLTVTAEDQSGHIVTGYAGTVDFSSFDPREPLPAGNLSFQAGAGVAATLATLETAGSWTITAADAANPAIQGSSAAVTVTAAPAAAVVFSQPPTGTSAGTTIPVTVQVVDPYGNVISSGSFSTANVTLAILSGPVGAKLLGTTTVQAVGGVAGFNNLAVDKAGSYSLIASGAGVRGTATSNSFTVTVGPATQLAFTTQPGNTPGAETMADVAVAVEDAYGNVVTGDNSSVTLTLNVAASGGGGVLHGTTTATAAGGVATFSGLSIVNSSNPNWSTAGTGYTLTASDTDAGVALTPGKSTAFNTTLIVTSCTMTPTGFVTTFSQPFEVATTPLAIGPNLYSAAASNDLPVNVALIGSNEGVVRGSLVVNSTDTQITFVATTLVNSSGLPIAGVSSPDATSGVLAPDVYAVVLDSTSTSFVTTNGQLLDGADSGTGGTNFNQATAVDNSADVDVVIPSFARGPSGSLATSVVNVTNASAPIAAAGLSESGNTVTVTTTVPDGLVVGDPVTISGAGIDGYNGTFTVTSLPGGANGTTFTYTDATSGLAASGGGTASLARGIPISLSGPTAGVTLGQFTLTYNSSDLTISGALVDPSLAASYGATLSLDAASTPGNAIIDFSTTAPLPSANGAPILLSGLMATVPSAAMYRAMDLLHFSSVSLSTAMGSIAAVGADALHLVVFPGDTTGGDGYISSADRLNMSRVVAGADTGFAAYRLTDPDLIGDLLGDGAVDGPAGALLGRYVNGVTSPQMPVYPGHPVNMPSVASPTTSVPSAAEVGVAGDAISPTSVIDTEPLAPADATVSLVAGPMAALGTGTAAKSGAILSQQAGTPTVAVRVSQRVADKLFAALARGPVDADESAVLGNIAESALNQGLTAQASEAESTQADIDRLLWESGGSSWLDSENGELFSAGTHFHRATRF